jgi:FkbM family methyltransferase
VTRPGGAGSAPATAEPPLVAAARRLLPPGARATLRTVRDGGVRTGLKLAWLRWRLALGSDRGRIERFGGYAARIRDRTTFYMAYKDIFARRIYHFESARPDPLILDCGSNIGMSILYFKQLYPRARVIGFEADPTIFPDLEENVTRNHLAGVRLVHAALGSRPGFLTLDSDGRCGSFVQAGSAPVPEGWQRFEVPCVRLQEFLTEEVDFLKMNIEGAEWEVLADCGALLRRVREMVIEYHHLPGLPRTLHRILALLDEQGFDYLINDLDEESNGGVIPPFHLDRDSRYFLLVYARRQA